MADSERLKNFRARFGIARGEDWVKQFRVRVLRAANTSLAPILWDDRVALEQEFELRSGLRLVFSSSFAGAAIRRGITDHLEEATTFTAIVELLQHLLWSFETLGYFGKERYYTERDGAGVIFVGELRRAIELTPGVDLRVVDEGKRFELAPAGVPVLDDVVDRATEWLARYPGVQKEFRQAQLILAEKKRDQYRQAQDSLRFALEKLLKLLLENDTRLEDQGKPLKEWLAKRGVREELREIAVAIMNIVTRRYQNEAVKHDNNPAAGIEKRWSDAEVEYVLYQHATLIRLLTEAADAPVGRTDPAEP